MRQVVTGFALSLALMVASCGGQQDPGPPQQAGHGPVRIGTKNFTESVILGELYRQALEAKGLKVELQSRVGSTELTNAALRDGSLDLYPEYIGVLLSEVDNIRTRPASPRAAYLLAKSKEESRDFTLLKPARLSNENALAVTTSFARRERVRSIRDLKRLRPAPRLGALPEFANRFEGLVGLDARYGLQLSLKPVEAGRQYAQLDRGRIDVAGVFTTDPQLAGGRYKLLHDPEGVFAKQNVVPLVSKKALKAHGPRLAATLDSVSALLTNPAMQTLNRKVEIEKRSPEQVAGEFLSDQGLTGPASG